MTRAHRIETTQPGTRVRVSLRGQLLADSSSAVRLREGGLPERWYLPRSDVHAELVESSGRSHCPFKGDANYLSVRLADGELAEDLVWYYPEPKDEVREIAGLLCFYTEKVDLDVGEDR